MSNFTDLERDNVARHLRKHIAGEVRFDAQSRRLYSTDASIYQVEPLGVVIPRTVEDLVATVQIAAECRLSITARGGGTSLSGQAVGPGIILDCSKYLSNILAIDPEVRMARVQPGVVLDPFNRALAAHGLQFGPDVSTASRANLGGMIGNNSAGSRSIVYGKTIDHVRSLSVILSDGTRAEFGPLGPEGWALKEAGTSLEAHLYRRVREVVRGCADEIAARFPRILRRVSGYNLDALLPLGRGTAYPFTPSPLTPRPPLPPKGERGSKSAQPPLSPLVGEGQGVRGDYLLPESPPNGEAPLTPHPAPVGLHSLVVGSEGTLALVAEAEVNLVPRPRHRGLLVPQFASLRDAMSALAPCLEMGPSAVELMDRLLLELTAGNLALREAMKPIQGNPHAIFLVEFSGDTEEEVADRVHKLARKLRHANGLIAAVPALDPAVRDPLWNLRRAAMPLLYGLPGDRKPITFVEDTAVDPARLPEFAARFRDLLQRHGTDGAFYGHASVGCLHIRPVLNLKDPADVVRMRQITEEVTDLVLAYGGSLSGEHGDGLARSEWNRKMFGPVIYDAFKAVKAAFDPHGLFNPGKIVDAPPMTENLRYPPGYRPAEPATVFDYSRQEGFLRSVEMCNGNGACRKTSGGAMCPSYRATLDERDSTRGRANALRHALSLASPPPSPNVVPRPLRERWVHEVFDLCLMCKACKAECPSNVDVAKLKAEFLNFYYRGRPRPLGHLLMAGLPLFNRLAAPFGPLANLVQENRLVRWLMDSLAGIDRRRTLPALHARHFKRWFRKHRPDEQAGKHGKVYLLADCFTTYNEPSVGQQAVRVLERAGYKVELLDFWCCGRVLISKGFLDRAKGLVRSQSSALARKVAGGTPILGLEPSCLLTLADEWTELLPGADTQLIASRSFLADSWLAQQVEERKCELPLRPRQERCVLHGHCHQKTLLGVAASAPALKLVPGLEVEVLDAGCCGMAGSFGYEKEHYDISVKIANLALLPALEKEKEAVVAAPGTSCRHQIRDLAGRRALHPLEVLGEQL